LDKITNSNPAGCLTGQTLPQILNSEHPDHLGNSSVLTNSVSKMSIKILINTTVKNLILKQDSIMEYGIMIHKEALYVESKCYPCIRELKLVDILKRTQNK
jgi:hypothetical protein